MKIETIYLDLDGVVFDFDSLYFEWFGLRPEDVEGNQKLFHKYFGEFISRKGFQELALMPDAVELLTFLEFIQENDRIAIEVLTACGGIRRMDEVMMQKSIAIGKKVCPHLLVDAVNFSVNSKSKKGWAKSSALLIDDRADNVAQFIEAGGQAILHTSAKSTIHQLYQYGF